MFIKSIPALFLLTACLAIFACSCSSDLSPDSPDASCNMPSPSGFGATQGGVQDMGLARELIGNGLVPPAAAFTVEGMFSEHDLPLEGDTSESILNLRGAVGVTNDLVGEEAGWIQVGMSSNLDPDTFERPSLSVIACVDVSGSMGWFYHSDENEYLAPGSIARLLLTRLTAQLDGNDRVGIVTYGSNVSVALNPVAANSPSVQAAIEGLNASGSTNMEAGLMGAYEMAYGEQDAGTDDVRVILFTDVQPNVGATSGDSFRAMADAAADEHIGLTVFGLGVGMGQEVMNAMSDLWGGNAFSLFDYDDVDELVEMNWPWLVVPIAHGLSMQITTPAGITVDSAFGFPGGAEGELGFNVASVFPSHRKGALLACLKADEGVSLEGVSIAGNLTYETVSGESVSQDLTWDFPGEIVEGQEPYFDQPVVGKTVALAIMVSGMKTAAEQYGEDPEGAVALMLQVAARIQADADDLGDEDLMTEAALATNLLALMASGAEQGDMYGWGF